MTNFGTMRYKHIISVVLWSMFLVACGPDRRVALAEKLMAEKETDSAIAVMQEIKEPQNNLTDRDYALYALLLSEAMHRKQQLNAETDTLLLPAINISVSREILCMPNGRCTARRTWTGGCTA